MNCSQLHCPLQHPHPQPLTLHERSGELQTVPSKVTDALLRVSKAGENPFVKVLIKWMGMLKLFSLQKRKQKRKMKKGREREGEKEEGRKERRKEEKKEGQGERANGKSTQHLSQRPVSFLS